MLTSWPPSVQFAARRGMILILFIAALYGAVPLSAGTPLSIKVRLQSRLDAGPITRNSDRTAYDTDQDAYLRRARLELVGRPNDRLHYIFAFSADRWDQQGRTPEVILGYALLNYQFSTALGLQFGIAKLPYSRGALVSSSRLLLVERAPVADLGARLFKYFAPHLIFHGRLGQGAFAYQLALTDGWQAGDSDRAFSGQTTTGGNLGTVLRLELSPPGWIEKRKSASHLGAGRHLSLGLNGAWQDDIELETIGAERRLLLGADLSFHHRGLSLATEYIYMQRDGSTRIETGGWYVEGGYFLNGLNIEPAVRYGLIDRDANGTDDKARVFTGGVNWYVEGHALKIQANIAHHSFDRNAREVRDEGGKTVLQIQNQLYF